MMLGSMSRLMPMRNILMITYCEPLYRITTWWSECRRGNICMSYEEEPRYCVNCGQPLTSAAEMFLCWMCEEEEQKLLEEDAEKEAEDTDGDGLFDDELEDEDDGEY